MTNVYDDLMHHYRTFSIWRWMVLAFVLFLFYAYVEQKRQNEGQRDLDSNRFRSFSESGELIMSDIPRDVDVKVLKGYHEPNNLEARVLVSILLDFSYSMHEHAKELPGVLQCMSRALGKRTLERLRIELACCAFDGRVVYQDYAPVSYYLEKPLTFNGGGFTALGSALLVVIENTRHRRDFLRSEGIDCYRSVCPVVSDGKANDGDTIQKAIEEIRRAEEEQIIEFVPLAPDSRCVDTLRNIFAKKPIPLPEVDFDILFAAFRRSFSTYSQSMPGFEPEARSIIQRDVEREYKRLALPAPISTRRIGFKGA